MNSAVHQQETSSQLARGYLTCFFATLLLSTTGIFIRYLTLTYKMPPLLVAFWRDFFVAAVLGIVLTIFFPHLMRLPKKNGRFIVVYGLVLALFNSLWTVSVAINGAAVSTVLAYSSTAFTAVLGWWFLGESLGRMKITAVTLSLLGCIFVAGALNISAWQLNPLGIVTGIGSGLGFAVYSLFGRAASKRSIGPWTGIIYTFGIAAGFIFLFNFFPTFLPEGVASINFFWLDGALSGWLVLFLLAVGPTIGGFGLYNISLANLPASVANILMTLEPALTAILAFFLLGERFTPSQWIGSALIITGVVVLRLSQERATPLEAL